MHADGGLCSNIKVDGDSLFWVDVLRRHEVAWTIGPNGNQPERDRERERERLSTNKQLFGHLQLYHDLWMGAYPKVKGPNCLPISLKALQ